MKKNLLLTFVIAMAMIFSLSANAQNVGIGTTIPYTSAMLDIRSTNKGLLIPHVSLVNLTDINTIGSPVNGLMIYSINDVLPGGRGFYYNNGTVSAPSWLRL